MHGIVSFTKLYWKVSEVTPGEVKFCLNKASSEAADNNHQSWNLDKRHKSAAHGIPGRGYVLGRSVRSRRGCTGKQTRSNQTQYHKLLAQHLTFQSVAPLRPKFGSNKDLRHRLFVWKPINIGSSRSSFQRFCGTVDDMNHALTPSRQLVQHDRVRCLHQRPCTTLGSQTWFMPPLNCFQVPAFVNCVEVRHRVIVAFQPIESYNSNIRIAHQFLTQVVSTVI